MWPQRLRTADRHNCTLRKCVTVISVLVIINTAIHWSLVADVHSRYLRPIREDSASKSEDGFAPYRDRVISINKWYDDLNGPRNHDGRELTFDVKHDDGHSSEHEEEKDPLIIYITRKPSNRRPLGETLTKRDPIIAEPLLADSLIRSSAKSSVFSHNTNKVNTTVQKVEASRKQIDKLRRGVHTKKREIRNKSAENREIVLPFLQRNKTKWRAAANGRGSNGESITGLISRVESLFHYSVLEIHSDENIRYYSQPKWLSNEDINAMNMIVSSWIFGRHGDQHLTHFQRHPVLIVSNAEIKRLMQHDGGKFDAEKECGRARTSTCQAAWCLSDLGLVVAFHLDRVIGLNVTPPTVARELLVRARLPTAPRRVVGGESKDSPSSSAHQDDLHVQTVALVMTSLSPGARFRHAEFEARDSRSWAVTTASNLVVSSDLQGKLYIYCFLLKISNCSNDMWKSYYKKTRHSERPTSTEMNTVPCHEIVTSPIRVFRASSVPEVGVLHPLTRISKEDLALLHSGRIRQRLLQSFFVDRAFWAEAGGRRGIEDVLNVIDRRIKELVSWLSTHSRRIVDGSAVIGNH